MHSARLQIKSGQVMAHITLIETIRPQSLGKNFGLSSDGTLIKNVIANISEGTVTTLATVTPKRLKNILNIASLRDDITLMPGRFINEQHKAKAKLITQKSLAKKLDCSESDVPGGVQEIGDERCVARLKTGIEPSDWIVIDADDPAGIPDKWRVLNLQERLELLEPLVAGISTCLRVEYRSSSARVVKDGEQTGGATHAWIQISDPAKMEILREHVKVNMQLQELSFPSPRYSKETKQVIGHEQRTVIDLAVWRPGRLVFCSKPTVSAEGYAVVCANVEIVNSDGGILDVSSIELPSGSDLKQLQKETGRLLSYSCNNGLKVSDTSTLSLDTEIEIKGVSKSLFKIMADMKPGDKVRCETPFRASQSEAAFIRLLDNGLPMLHDVGTSTNYYLSAGHETRLRDANIINMPSPFSDETAGSEFAQRLAYSGSHGEDDKMPASALLDDPQFIMLRGKSPIANHSNAMAIIRYAAEWDGVLAYNELSENLVLLRPIPGSRTPKSTFKPRAILDHDFISAVAWFNRHGFPSIGKDKVIDAVETVAKETVISPIRHYLEDLETRIKWHPSTHSAKLSRLFQDYFGTIEDAGVPGADPKYLSTVGQKFMISAVARALRPGCKVDTMLVLEGDQGAGKSSAARILAGVEYFSDNLPTMGTKDASDHVRGKWIIEVGELSAMQKSEIETTKAFISRQEEKFRPAYNRKEITYPRRCVFIGTTNQRAYLRDETGNRRFWPVQVGKINLAALQRDRDLLWAEAVYWYKAGVKWYLSTEEEAMAKEVQSDRVSEDIWQEQLSIAIEGITEISLTEAAKELFLDTAKVSRADQNRITASLKGLGFVREGKFTKGANRNSARYTRKN